MPYNVNLWTVTDLRIAREMADRGCTAKEIGNAIGRSKSSVIGYFNRQGLSLGQKRGGNISTKPKPEAPPPPQKLKEEDLPPTKTFMQLTSRNCRAISGKPRGVYTEYCGRDVMKAGHAWCSEHHKMYYGIKKEIKHEHKQKHSRNDFLFAK